MEATCHYYCWRKLYGEWIESTLWSGLSIDDDEHRIYIANSWNARIVEWKFEAKKGEVVVGRNGEGKGMDQLSRPAAVMVDPKTDSLIICDQGNRRLIRWPRRHGKKGQTIISDIDCYGVTMDKHGDFYVSDSVKHEVRRWKIGETKGTIVAGGNDQGNQFHQLAFPTYIFVDEDQSVYVSDRDNHRVMK
jgi:sugar lactone lactonase YvrE